ncbi:hypothetical protein JXB28_04960 [Candidatus Woesearchaeota archaeon]|nr:hypothetical protein [Candidatus Woesearchaeota archaeon]
MIHKGRAFINAVVFLALIALMLGLIDTSSLTSAGKVSIALPVSPIILAVILALIFIVDFALLGGPWAPLYSLIGGILILQNWITGLLLAMLHAALLFTIGRLGRP